MGLEDTMQEQGHIILCPVYKTTVSHLISIPDLDFFKVEGRFAVFTVERSCFTFSLVMSLLLRTKDGGLAGLALHLFKFTAVFMLSLKMEDRYIITMF